MVMRVVLSLVFLFGLTGCAGMGSAIWTEIASNWRDTSLGNEPNLFEQRPAWDDSYRICCAFEECEWWQTDQCVNPRTIIERHMNKE